MLLIGSTLNDEIDARVIATKSIGSDTSEEGRIAPIQFLDAQIWQYSSG